MSLNVELVEQSFQRVKPHANEFVASFYENLLTAYPEVKPLFAKIDMATQRKKLLNALILVVENLRHPEVLGDVLNSLGVRHIGYGAIPEYYTAVGKALLVTFEQYLQTEWTPEVKQAWEDAFGAIATQMLQGARAIHTTVESEQSQLTPEPPMVKPSVTPNTSNIEDVSDVAASDLPVDLLEKSFAIIKPRAEEFVASFYENLFIAHPEVKPLFVKIDMVTQQKKLLNALVLIIENLRNSESLEQLLSALGARHVGYGAIAKYYPAVGEALLTTFEQYLQEDWTLEVKQAWTNAFGAIASGMLQGARVEPSIKTSDERVATSKQPIEFKTQLKDKFQIFQSQSFIQQWIATLKQIPEKIVHAFWTLPAWQVVIIALILLESIFVIVDDNSFFSEIVNSVDTVSVVIALVLFVKEAPDRRKQFHYQAWSTIDAAHDVRVSYARILALQDLNEDGVPLRGLDAPGTELINIHLPKADLSEANLNETDLSNANLNHANLNNAKLNSAKLSGANLSHTNLSFAQLSHVNLSSANLSHANLICADLSHANLSGVNLKHTSLSGAKLEGAYLTGANLKNAKVSVDELSGAFLEGAIMPDGSRYQSLKNSTETIGNVK
ncbi:globin [Scytonema sp. UIC 10036]|uniref:globin domain-containing protein n=1 Tax=Scytonema sp. UIC 10036 TaxID=2304196 RepID=UPI0012DA1F4B|nr:globin domain-containing protein [Scytonema sp. UIC 10036]MUG98493.1 globin [Scytonema sp. UIC 10036]